MDLKDIQNLIKFVAKSGASEVKKSPLKQTLMKVAKSKCSYNNCL